MNIHLWAPRFEESGGISAFSRELARALAMQGDGLRLFGKSDTARAWEGCRLSGTGRIPERARTPAFAATILTACGNERPDGILSAHLNFGPVAAMAKRYFRTPYLLVAHGIEVSSDLSVARRLAVAAADCVIAVSSWTRDRLVSFCDVSRNRIRTLPNTFDERRFTPGSAPEALRNRYALRPEERVILTVARLSASERYKGYDRVLKVLRRVHYACGPVRYLLVGSGNDRARVEIMSRDLGVAEMVTFAGCVPDEEIVDHYRLADLFAMPSNGEGFGIVFLEAMACGCPVVAGNKDGSVDALKGGRFGKLVDPNSSDELALAIIDLLARHGNDLWFEPPALHRAVSREFGRAAFRDRLKLILGELRNIELPSRAAFSALPQRRAR